MREIVSGIYELNGATGSVKYQNDFILTINTAEETDIAIATAKKAAGKIGVIEDCPTCGASEDFAQMLRVKPGCYILIGNGTEGHCGSSLHNPHYDLNDDILEIGRDYWVPLITDQLSEK